MKCLHPVTIKNPNFGKEAEFSRYIDVPCGKCIACQSNRRSSWVLRNKIELYQSNSAIFVTLTYDDDNLPRASPDIYTLKYRDTQLFLKRLRKKYGIGIKYFLCGEYGSHTGRPHYHAIIYNLPLLTNGKDFVEYYNKEIQNIWHLGNVTSAIVTDQRIGYITKYIVKSERDKEFYKEFGLESPALRVSKNLGANLVVHCDGDFQTAHLYGQSAKVPRYILDKLRANRPKVYYKLIRARKYYVADAAAISYKREQREWLSNPREYNIRLRRELASRRRLEDLQDQKMKSSKKQKDL